MCLLPYSYNLKLMPQESLFLSLGRVPKGCRKQEAAEEARMFPGELGAGFKVQSPQSSGFIPHPADFLEASKSLPSQLNRRQEGGREIIQGK